MIKFLTFFLTYSSFTIFAQTYQYELRGKYKLDSSHKLPVEYSIRWSNENGKIEGQYKDNYFSRRAVVTGEDTDVGRTMVVIFPFEKDRIKSMTVMTSLKADKQSDNQIPVSIVARDGTGNPIMTINTNASFKTTSFQTSAQLQVENQCTEGFGSLAGFCGVYGGFATEDLDRRNKCNLLYAEALRLELSLDGSILLYLDRERELITREAHYIGRLANNPESKRIDLLNRICGPLVGVNSSNQNCKIVNLRGEFSAVEGKRNFSGTYIISEEGTQNFCKYSFAFKKMEED